MKGYSQSSLGPAHAHLPANLRKLYERVWDEADYVVPPAENGAFFITTNVVITPNQTLGQCPEVRLCTQTFFLYILCHQDPEEVPASACKLEDSETSVSSDCFPRRQLVKSKDK